MSVNKIYKVLGKKGRITIPFEFRQKVGFKYNDILSFTKQDDGSILITKEKLCNNCSEQKNKENADSVTLKDFLDSLSNEQQRAALIHLSVKWAEKQENGLNEDKYI